MRSSLLFLSASVLLFAAVMVSAQDPTFTTPGGYRATFNGNSGKMKLFPQSEEASKFIQLSWDKIVELDMEGEEVQSVKNFASQPDFVISGPEEIIYDAGSRGLYNATRIILDATVQPTGARSPSATAKFVVTVLAFKTDVTIPYGNTTVSVLRDNLKFTVDVNDWPFKSTTNSLTFGTKVLTPGSAKGNKKSADVYQFDSANLIVQDSAIVNGITTVPVNTTLDQTGSNSIVMWSFPYFSQSLKYDPDFGFASDLGAASAGATGAAAIVLALLAACAMLVQ